MNPHLFASPRMAAQMTRSIAGQLADLDPANAATYWANAENYARTLDALADEFAALGGKLKNSRIITQHGYSITWRATWGLMWSRSFRPTTRRRRPPPI